MKKIIKHLLDLDFMGVPAVVGIALVSLAMFGMIANAQIQIEPIQVATSTVETLLSARNTKADLTESEMNAKLDRIIGLLYDIRQNTR